VIRSNKLFYIREEMTLQGWLILLVRLCQIVDVALPLAKCRGVSLVAMDGIGAHCVTMCRSDATAMTYAVSRAS
jgi:hypothetical protein